MDLEGLVGAQRALDGDRRMPRLGNQGEVITGEMFGKHFEQTLRGNVFLYHIASQAILLSATTGGHPTVINPAGSGVLFVPLALRVCFTSGTTTISSVLIAETLNCGAGAATGGVIATATLVDAKCARRPLGRGRTLWSPTTNTFAAAPTVIYSPGINLGAAAPSVPGPYECKFDGTLAFEPGSAMSVTASVTTTTSLWHITIVGAEVPI